MITCIKHVAKEFLGEFKKKKINAKEIWQWSNKIKKSIKKKREYFKVWQMSKDDRMLKEYKIAKQEIKKQLVKQNKKLLKNYTINQERVKEKRIYLILLN